LKKGYGKDRAWLFAEGGGGTVLLVVAFIGAAIGLWLLWPESILLDIVLFLVALLGIFVLYFFRDPNRQVAREPGVIVAPADGKIVAIVTEPEPMFLQQTACRISIFLSVFDVHVQRAPVSGRVLSVDHRPGAFLQAFRPEASEVNEFIAMILETEHGRVLVKQIAGILARRCVNYAEVGATIEKGERFGLIKFGSRVDLFLPPATKVLVAIGDQVYGGLTPLARFSSGEGDEQ
jgi:phosphatidylserine decarboxylase